VADVTKFRLIYFEFPCFTSYNKQREALTSLSPSSAHLDDHLSAHLDDHLLRQPQPQQQQEEEEEEEE
jgi:hypothetical protein